MRERKICGGLGIKESANAKDAAAVEEAVRALEEARAFRLSVRLEMDLP